MRRDLLLQLADFVESLPPAQFDLSVWATPAGRPSCAVGWATQLDNVPLHLVEDIYEPNGRGVIHDDDLDGYKRNENDTFELADGFAAAARAFELQEHEVDHLFKVLDLIDSPQEWAAHCRAFVAQPELALLETDVLL